MLLFSIAMMIKTIRHGCYENTEYLFADRQAANYPYNIQSQDNKVYYLKIK